jgi:hypothetical protein
MQNKLDNSLLKRFARPVRSSSSDARLTVNIESGVTGQKLTDPELAYFAGYLDGEGCFMYGNSPEVDISNTYPHTLMEFKAAFNGAVALKSRGEGRTRTSYRYRVSGSNAIRLCKAVLPYLKEKKSQAETLITMFELPRGSESFRVLMQELTRLKRINYE